MEKNGTGDPISKQKWRQWYRELMYGTKGKGLGWEELEYWDWHIHTIDTMYKIDNRWEYTV